MLVLEEEQGSAAPRRDRTGAAESPLEGSRPPYCCSRRLGQHHIDETAWLRLNLPGSPVVGAAELRVRPVA